MQLTDLIRELEAVTDVGRPLVVAVEDLADGRAEAARVSPDSRVVEPGTVFVAVPGTKVDGHRFIADAAARGAVAVVVERTLRAVRPDGSPLPRIVVRDARLALAHAAAAVAGHPSRRLTVAGITGTNGKSTTAFLLRSMLEAADRRVGLVGTILYQIDRRTIPAPLTTPDGAALQDLLADMVEAHLDAAVMEVSSHALDQRRTDAVAFDVGCFTNLSRDHGDYHRTREDYIRAKGRLFQALDPQATAVLNADDPVSYRYANETDAAVLWYGTEGDVHATVSEQTLDGTRFTLHVRGDRCTVRTRLVGRHNVDNAIAAAACANAVGVGLEAIAAGIEALDAVPGRLERVDAGQPFHILVDYAHTDDALERVCASLRPLVGAGRLIVVFGAGGDRDRQKRPLMAKAVAAFADSMWITSDNPRSEDPAAIVADIEAGVPPAGERRSGLAVHREIDRRLAIAAAVDEAREGDLVLIAGKGHERTQKLRDVEIPFDDCLVAREAVARRRSEGVSRPVGSGRANAAV